MSATPRIAPAAAPYPPEVQARFDALMPQGVAPLLLFRVLARDLRLFQRFMGAGLLDKGHLSLRQRELVIDRVIARCGSEYEWGVHVAFFAGRVGLSDRQVTSLAQGQASDPCWADERDRLLIEAADALHDTADIGDDLWYRLTRVFTDEQLLDLLMLAGWYHAISFAANAARVAREDWAPRLPGA